MRYYAQGTEQFDWLKSHKKAFQDMTNEESKVLREIFKYKKFQEGVKEKNIRDGKPEADAILVAKAKCVKGIIVTDESGSKPNSSRIPNICEKFGVPFIGGKDFYIILQSNL
jgi:hypothetical protein